MKLRTRFSVGTRLIKFLFGLSSLIDILQVHNLYENSLFNLIKKFFCNNFKSFIFQKIQSLNLINTQLGASRKQQICLVCVQIKLNTESLWEFNKVSFVEVIEALSCLLIHNCHHISTVHNLFVSGSLEQYFSFLMDANLLIVL